MPYRSGFACFITVFTRLFPAYPRFIQLLTVADFEFEDVAPCACARSGCKKGGTAACRVAWWHDVWVSNTVELSGRSLFLGAMLAFVSCRDYKHSESQTVDLCVRLRNLTL